MSATLNTETLITYFDDFDDEGNTFRFLSNFYVGEPLTLPRITWSGGEPIEFMTGEHAFQAFKAATTDGVKHIINADKPGEAKRRGRRCELRHDWELIKYDVMAAVVRAKFTLDRPEGRMLLNTGTALLVEGTYWGDQVWGVDLNKGDRPGRNWLGTLLMARRAELVGEELWGLTPATGEHNVAWVQDPNR